MPTTLNESVADIQRSRVLQLMRFDAGMRAKVRTMLRGIERELTGILADVDPTEPARLTYRRQRQLALQQELRAALARGASSMRREVQRDLTGLAEQEATLQRRVVANALGVDLLTVSVPHDTLRALAGPDLVIQGTPARDYWQRIAQNTQRRFMDAIRSGMVQGQSVDEMTRRVRGTKAQHFMDGVLQASRRETEALVRTSIMAVNNAVHEQVYRTNDDVVRGVQALVTFDDRTTELCLSRSGAAWDLETGEPLPDSPRDEPYPGPPPWHFNCRTVLIPVLKSMRQIAADGGRKADQIRELPKGTRATMDGQIAADTPVGDWLRGKGQGFVADLIGKRKAEAFFNGELKISDLTDQSGRTLSLKDLGLAGERITTSTSTAETTTPTPTETPGPVAVPLEPWEVQLQAMEATFAEPGITTVAYEDSPRAREHLTDASLIPQHLIQTAAEKGVAFRIGKDSVADWPEYAHLKTVQPRGWEAGKTWADVGGMYDPEAMTVVVGKKKGVSVSTFLHEFGHSIDPESVVWQRIYHETTALYDRIRRQVNEFEAEFQAGFRWGEKYFRQPGRAGPQEAFAESFATYLKRGYQETLHAWGKPVADFLEQFVKPR